jgi:hypothetical protein
MEDRKSTMNINKGDTWGETAKQDKGEGEK